MSDTPASGRTMGLLGATGVGLGAIVGGGILALAGVAFAAAGPGAIVAFALNGLIAMLTALSFAEMSASFPESGGTYTFAKKVLSVEAAFMVGWVVWFASIVAAVLYAMGFAAYGALVLDRLWQATAGSSPAWLGERPGLIALAVGATAFYTVGLMRRSAGGGRWETVGKLVVFVALIAGGIWALARQDLGTVRGALSPFFPHGAPGVLQAMGFTFIALQGFDLIAAVGGEVRAPGRNIPRAMILSLAAALVIYLPFLFIISTVGVEPGGSITAASAESPETVVAAAAHRYLGPVGLWLVVVAALLSMLSALHANLLAASRVALAMARDRTLPGLLGTLYERRGTPVAAIAATSLTVVVLLLVIPDLAAAGAAASLIFLISFALAHWANILTRRRGGVAQAPFRLPWFPLVPVVGGLACLALATFQGVAVPAAGWVAALWLGLGGALYFSFLAPRAGVVDASTTALDPQLVRLRGRSPLVLVPIANPASAEGLVEVASALTPPDVGRVLLLSVVRPPATWEPGKAPQPLIDAQAVLGESLTASFAASLAPEALITVAPHPWSEIARVARTYRCESLLLGLGKLTEEVLGTEIERLMSSVNSDVVVLRAPPRWRLGQVRRVLVPVGGRRDQSKLRARLLGSLCRSGGREISFLGVLPSRAPREAIERAGQELHQLARDEVPGASSVIVARSDSVAPELVRRAAAADLMVLGLQRLSRRRKVFGAFVLRVARETSCPILLISRRG